MIATILLLPNADTRERVLAPHAPSCRRLTSGAASWGTLVGELGDVRHYVPFAGSCPIDRYVHLVLARDGAEVYEGIDRAGRVLGALPLGPIARIHAAALELEIAVLLGHEPDMNPEVALERLRQIVAPLGTLVFLDENGAEVSGV